MNADHNGDMGVGPGSLEHCTDAAGHHFTDVGLNLARCGKCGVIVMHGGQPTIDMLNGMASRDALNLQSYGAAVEQAQQAEHDPNSAPVLCEFCGAGHTALYLIQDVFLCFDCRARALNER